MRFLRFATLAAILMALGGAPAQAGFVTGDIAVYNAAGTTLIGYVSATYDGQNSFTYTTNIADALQVEINTPVSAPFSMLEVNPPVPNSYFGAVGGSGGSHMAPGNFGYTYLSGTSLAAAGSTPSSSATNDIQSLGYNAPSESTI
jgi:hypothetical protein